MSALYTVLEDVDAFTAPWGKNVAVQKVEYEGGLILLRVRIKEGSRFTLLDLDPATAGRLAETLAAWTKEAGGGSVSA
ncbi:MAG: hypothetical protein FJX42_02965 [Alphaproteobacteria bacterium]|nr:hypothetical protein [Alphaproteobacteria bacterium]